MTQSQGWPRLNSGISPPGETGLEQDKPTLLTAALYYDLNMAMAPTILRHAPLIWPTIGRKSLMAMGIPGFTTLPLQAQGPGLMVIPANKVAVAAAL
jgi:hypothetical protein